MIPTLWTGTIARPRLSGLDRLRGLALVLMVLDHVLLVTGQGAAVRLTLTRASLPLFGLVAGALLARRPHWSRLGGIAAAGLAATCLGVVASPDVLLLLVGVLALAPLITRYPVAALAVGVLQPVTWPIPWAGYQPGTLLALVAAGWLAGRAPLNALGQKLPSQLAPVGRYPLTLYVGHLAVIAAVPLVLAT